MTEKGAGMRVVRDPLHGGALPRGGTVTIGNFDGVHRGHQAILRRVAERAEEAKRPSVAITFEPHPLAVLRPDQAPPRLQTLRQKEEGIEALGIETLLVVPFTRDFSLTEPEEFARRFLAGRLAAAEIFLGPHFAFGRGKRGDVALLSRLGPDCGFTASSVEEVLFEGEPISSTRIRNAIRGGRVSEAVGMLGRPYAIDGMVAKGEGLGRTLGFPTINLTPENELYPADGVYVTRIALQSAALPLPAVTNVGTRPTLYAEKKRTIETHVLDFSTDVYGERARLAFFDRLRDERAFPSREELSRQIGRDVDAARRWIAGAARSAEPPG